jgi:uncharacterized Zn finger protein
MDDFSQESLQSLLHKKIKVEANGSFFVGELLSINNRELIVRGKKYRKRVPAKTGDQFAIPIDVIDAIMTSTNSKKVNY